jgi:hypothetical protein
MLAHLILLAAIIAVSGSAAAADDELYDVRGPAIRPGQVFRLSAKMTGKPLRITLASEGVIVQETKYETVHVHEGEYIVEAADDRKMTRVRVRVINGESTNTRFEGEQEYIDHEVDRLVGRTIITEIKDGISKSRLAEGKPTEADAKSLDSLPLLGDDSWFPKEKVRVGTAWKMPPERYGRYFSQGTDVKATGEVTAKFVAVQAFEGRRCAVIRATGTVRGTCLWEGRSTNFEVDIDSTQYRSLDTHTSLLGEHRHKLKAWGPLKHGNAEYLQTHEATIATTYRTKELKDVIPPETK